MGWLSTEFLHFNLFFSLLFISLSRMALESTCSSFWLDELRTPKETTQGTQRHMTTAWEYWSSFLFFNTATKLIWVSETITGSCCAQVAKLDSSVCCSGSCNQATGIYISLTRTKGNYVAVCLKDHSVTGLHQQLAKDFLNAQLYGPHTNRVQGKRCCLGGSGCSLVWLELGY